MASKKSFTQMRSLRLLGVLAAAAGWSTLLWPGVRFYLAKPGSTIWSTLGELLRPTNSIYPDGFLTGWLFLSIGAVLLVAVPLMFLQILGQLLRYVQVSEVAISLLEVHLTLRFEDSEMRRCTITRRQLLHANQPGQGAYHYLHTIDNEGAEIVEGSFDMASTLGDELITEDFLFRNGKRRLEAIEVYKRALPTSIFATYLPDSLVILLYRHTKLFDNVVVERVGEIQNIDEYNGEYPLFELTSVRYPASNVSISIDFPKEVAPPVSDVRCFRIKANVVSPIHPRCMPQGDRRVFTAFVARLEQETLRFQWSNDRLRTVLAGLTPSTSPIIGHPVSPPPIKIGPIQKLRGGIRRFLETI
jgi:hypothetical protein